MTLRRKYIKNLIGGVSQQPDSLRFDNQCEEQENFLSDPIKGLLKRPGTDFVSILNEDTSDNTSILGPFSYFLQPKPPPFIHHIRRSGEEELILAIHNDYIGLWNATTGAKINIYSEAAKTTLIGLDDLVSTHVDDYLQFTSGDYPTKTPFEAISISDYTFILNKDITVAALAETNDLGNDTNGFIFIKEGEYSTTYSVKLTDTSSVTRAVTVKTAATGSAGASKDFKTSNIIDAIHWGLNGGSGTFNTTNAAAYADEDTTITVTYSDTGGTFTVGDFTFGVQDQGSALLFTLAGSTSGSDSPTLVVEDSWGNSITNGGIDEVDDFTGLPLSCWNNFHLKIAGNPGSESDDYYVRFETDDTGLGDTEFGPGKWKEAEAPGVTKYLNPETMPHVLVRIDATNYWYGPLDSGVGTGGSVADKEDGREQWTDRQAGDNTTNPMPSFVGQKINDLVFFKSRLGFCSGENLILSELDNPFNYFRTSVLQTLATDRIDITTSVNEVTELNWGVPFANQLIVFSDRSQFIVTFGQDGLTPQTAALSLITKYDCSDLAKPVALDNSVIFARKKGGATDIMELYPTGATNTSFEARNLTGHIPSYIDRDIIKIIPSSMAQSIILMPNSELNSSNQSEPILYIYKYYDEGNNRVQSSWSKYNLDHSVSYIEDVHLVDEEYRMVSLYPCLHEHTNAGVNKNYLIKYSYLRLDNTEDVTWSLDDIVTNSECTMTGTSGGYTLGYDAGNDWTIIQIPYGIPIAGGSQYVYTQNYTPVIVDDSGVTGTILQAPIPDTSGVNTSYDLIKVEGDWTGKTFTFGSSFTSTYTFSKQYLKRQDVEGKPMAVIDGRSTVRAVEVYFSNSQYMKLQCTYPDMNRDSTSKTFTGTIVGGAVIGDQSSETGTLRLFVGARNDVPVITLTSDTHQTATLTGASFSIDYNNRERPGRR